MIMILSILIMPFLFFQRIIMNVGLDLIFFPILWRRLCQAMMAEDAKKTLDMAIEWTGVEHVLVVHRPRLLSDKGPA